VARSTGIVGLDVEASQALLSPVFTLFLHLPDLLDTVHFTQQHHRTEIGEPVWTERLEGQRRDHWICVTLFNLAVEESTEIRDQRLWDLIRHGERQQCSNSRSIPEGDLARQNIRRRRSIGSWVGGLSRRPVDDRRGRVVQHGRHLEVDAAYSGLVDYSIYIYQY